MKSMRKPFTTNTIRHLIRACCIGLVFCCSIYVARGDTSMVGFSEFAFSYLGTSYSPTLMLTLTGGVETGFSFSIYNKEAYPMTYQLSFVDGGYTTPDNLRACKSEQETSSVGRYITGDTSPLTIGSHQTGTRNLTIRFPNNYSGLYRGCVMYHPITTGDADEINTFPRRGGFVDAYVTPTTRDFILTVRPTFRPKNPSHVTGYSISNADFRFFIYENGERTGIYNSAKHPFDPKITTDNQGRGIVTFIPPESGTQYLVAFKGSGTLSLGMTGIRNNDIEEFNFFSGAVADALSSEFMFDYYQGGITGHYLKVGDTVAYSIGTFDHIWDSDFALMTNYLTIGGTPLHPSRFDLDLNNVINALEQTMILDSYNRRGFIITQPYIPWYEFVTL